MMSRILLAFIISFLLFISCSDTKKNNSNNTFYVNYICKNDTLLDILKKATSGKVAYYDNDKQLQIVSLNYITEENPNSHYFKVEEELPVKPELNTIKYEIAFNDSMLTDNIAYSFKKYTYKKEGWKKTSDIGTLKVFYYLSARDKGLRIIKKNIAASVLKIIVIDSYSRNK